MEGGIRVPAIVRWPGVLPKGTVTQQPTLMMDFSASIVRLAGAKEPAHRPFDGIDILRHLQERRPVEPRTLFWRQRRGDLTWRAVRDGSLKYVSRQVGDKKEEHLFDLSRDPGEKNNLAVSRPDDFARLKKILAAWEEEVRPAR